MAKIKIKIQDLFDRISFNESPTQKKPEVSFTSPYVVKIKTHTGMYTPIKEFVKKYTDSYKWKFSNGTELIASDRHIIITENGEKMLKDIIPTEKITLLDGKSTFLEEYKLYKKNDILYDVCIKSPHLFSDTNGFIHHNSFMMALMFMNLLKKKKIKKQLIIVPSTTLITQLKVNFIDYGIDEKFIGIVYADEKTWNKPIVIATWHSLANNIDKVNEFDSIFCDECQVSQADVLSSTLEHATNAKYRIGFTGTLPNEQLLLWKIRSFLGPKLIEVTVDYLKQIGWLSDCTIHIMKLRYNKSSKSCFTGEYKEVKEKLFVNTFRLGVIKDIVGKIETGTVLLLIEKIAEGNKLMEEMKERFPDREVEFIKGSTKLEEREKWRLNCNDPNRKIILIATYPIFQAGVDIPALAHVVLASQVKSKIRVLQTIGRVLRKHSSKDGAHVYDLHDMYGTNSTFDRQNEVKMEFFEKEKFTVVDEEVIEPSPSTTAKQLLNQFF